MQEQMAAPSLTSTIALAITVSGSQVPAQVVLVLR